MNDSLSKTSRPGQSGNLPLAIEKAARVVYLMAMDGVISIDTGAPPELAEMARNALGLLGSLLVLRKGKDSVKNRKTGNSSYSFVQKRQKSTVYITNAAKHARIIASNNILKYIIRGIKISAYLDSMG